MTLKVKPPFTEADKDALIDFADKAIRSGRKIDDAYTGLTHDEALALILPGVGFRVMDAEFILAMARGELPNEEIGDNGEVLSVIY